MALRRAIGAVKDQTSISLARVNNTTDSMSELEIAVVKATRHEEYPPEERHVREILGLTHYSRHFVSACVSTIARRLNRTRNWVVALRCLILIQRLLTEGEPAYEQEVFFATRRGTRLLNLSDFRDTTGRSRSWDFSAFVRTFSLYLDERLEYRMQGKRKSNVAVTYAYAYEKHYYGEVILEEGGGDCATGDGVGELEELITKVQQLQQLIERFLATRPAGAAKQNRVVLVALYPAVKESFQTYYEITDILSHLIVAFRDVDLIEAVRLHDIFWRSAKQFDELDVYYTWTKEVGVARSSEYPEIERISSEKLELMDNFIREKSTNPLFSSPLITSDLSKQEAESESEEAEIDEDPNSIKALPAPPEDEKKEEIVQVKKDEPEQLLQLQHEGDLLNLWDEPMTSEQHGDELSLVLFDGPGLTETGPNPSSGSIWEAFKDVDSDWEAELVKSTSYLPQQRTQLGGGLDMLVLDGLYQQGSAASGSVPGGTGSESSVAFGSAGNPQGPMLALPPPPGWRSTTANGDGARQHDPFGPSMAVPPPSYVQMSELERKQRMMMEEQMMWQQYERGGMQGAPRAQYTQGYNPQMPGYKPYQNGYGYY